MALEINDDWDAVHDFAVRAAETAIELDPELTEGHAALGLTLLDEANLLGDKENKLARAERSLQRALELDPSLSIAYNWLSSTLKEQGRIEEANAVQEQGLLIDPLNPALSHNMADRLKMHGERERAEQMLLRLTYLPEPPQLAYTGLASLYRDTGQLDKALHWAKRLGLASATSMTSDFSAFLAGRYERLGLTEDASYWVADAVAHTPEPARRFLYQATQYQTRGDLAGIREELDKLHEALGTETVALQGDQAAVYAGANIYVGNFDVGIDALESEFDLESKSYGDLNPVFLGSALSI